MACGCCRVGWCADLRQGIVEFQTTCGTQACGLDDVQVEAIKSGVQPGLTMVVGPPGTGKTDTAVQIMHVLYHNCPGQRTLLITHSNQALNDLFEKILERDVPAR